MQLPATFMRGGTSKGLFICRQHLEALVGDDAAARDRLLLRLVGSPDRYGTQMYGMGGGSSSTSKVVLLDRSAREGHDVDYRFGAVAIDQPLIDWSGNCGNLSTAVGPFAIATGLVAAPRDGAARVRIWQVDIGKTIVATVPMRDGLPMEHGDCVVDGVAFAGAPIGLDFMDPGGIGDQALLPSGNVVDRLLLPDGSTVEVTLLNAGNPTVFIDAGAAGLTGTEMQRDINGDAALLQRLEVLRACAAVRMGLAQSVPQATHARPATPKLCIVAAPQPYTAVDGRRVEAAQLDCVARMLSMGRLHHAMTGTGVVALGVAAALQGSVVQRLLKRDRAASALRFGHPSGTAAVDAAVSVDADGEWRAHRVSLTRTARRLMVGMLPIPPNTLR